MHWMSAWPRLTISNVLRIAESIPSARISTLSSPSASISSLSHWMTVRSGMLAFSTGTRFEIGPRLMTNPPTCCERWRGKPSISRTLAMKCSAICPERAMPCCWRRLVRSRSRFHHARELASSSIKVASNPMALPTSRTALRDR